MKLIVVALAFISAASSIGMGQPLWNIGREIVFVHADREGLRSWISRKDGAPYDEFETARSAAITLAVNYGQSEKDFIIAHMQPWVDSLRGVNRPLFEKYYFYLQYMKGYLGDRSAISGMDSVARYFKNSRYNLGWRPIELLAEAGYYNYWDTIRHAFDPTNKAGVVAVIRLYGRDSRFHDEARFMIRQYILALPSGFVRFGPGASEMMTVDRTYGIQLLDSLFRASVGKRRLDYFESLEGYDRDNQPDRVMWVLPIEPDSLLRQQYLPQLGGGTGDDYFSRKYLEPRYVKFVKDQLRVESASSVHFELEWFRTRFIPLPLPVSVPVNSVIDSLISTENQVAGYGWVQNNGFARSLRTVLINARRSILNNDSVTAARHVRIFQKKVDAAHRDSVNAARSVNMEGWKFLHYQAQYVLDKLR